MRWVLSIAVVMGCYDPHAPTGARCDPDQPACPTGQTCILGAGGAFCSTGSAPVDGAEPDASVDAPVDAPSGMSLHYVPSVVACANPVAPPDPAGCEAVDGPGTISVDGDYMAHTWNAYIRVDLDDQLAGHTVKSVRLHMTVTSNANANSGNTGSVYHVGSFDLASLSIAVPPKVTTTPLAGSQGSVQQLDPVNWPLPTSLVSPGGQVYLSIESPSTDGVFYWSLTGATPPELIVDVL